MVKVISPHTEADPAGLLLQLLTSFGNVAGRGAYFVAEADKHYPNLFCVMVGATAKGRKGSSWGHIEKLFRAVDDEWVKACVHTGLSSGEGLIWAVRDAIEKTVPVKEKGRITGYQQETVDPGISDKRALILESEFASTLKVMSREGNTLSAVIRNAWDGRDLRTMTKNSAARATEPHISIIAHVTKDELNRYIESTEMGNGFANRFLFVCVRRANILPDGGSMQHVDLKQYAVQLREAVNFAKIVGERRREEGEARTLWHAVYPALSEGKPGLLGAATARAEAQVMRLALIYALLDRSSEIRVEHITAGVAVWEYAEASARFIFGESLGDPVADSISSALDANSGGLTRTEIFNLFGRHRNAGQISRALTALIGTGTVRRVAEKTGGRPTERWFSMKYGAN
ncbi:MAG: DUF3987 domain-containing protein [Nitrospinae bacterium]|nr:DUF3987 domain-containing protein [Nitrospinota bacterium]